MTVEGRGSAAREDRARTCVLRHVLLAVLLICAVQRACAAEHDQPLTVFAAASLAEVLQKIGAAYTKATQTPVRFSFAASSAVAKQIESAARADVFLSADEDWMDYLQARRLISSGTRRDLLGNRLVLIAPGERAAVGR